MNYFEPLDFASFNLIKTIDLHTAGEPLRVFISGYPEPEGETILHKRQYAKEHLDHLRQLLMYEPRGHADMYGAVITQAERSYSEFGVLFLHNEGYSTMCGHAIIALLSLCHYQQKGSRQVCIDSPAGKITGHISEEDVGREYSFQNVPSFVESTDNQAMIAGVGDVCFDIAFGGAYYAFVDADSIGLTLSPENSAEVIRQGKAITDHAREHSQPSHPQSEDLSFIYGTIFTSNTQVNDGKHSRHCCIFAEGELDRSPTGTGVSARAALLYEKGELSVGDEITIESIIGTEMHVRIESELNWHDNKSIVPVVSGHAYVTGIHQFLLDPKDPITQGFLLR